MADAAITDDIVAGGQPGAPNGTIPPIEGQQLTISADPRRSYLSGSQLQWYGSIPHALPFTIDDVARDFGADIYERILTDAQARSVVNVLRAGILENGVQLAPAVADEQDDGYAEAVALVEQAERMFTELTTPLDDVLWDMADAIALGNKVAEQTYRIGDDGSYVLSTLAVKPRESYAFVVDAYMTVLGILGRIPGEPFGVQVGQLLTDVEHTPNLLPRSKFAVLTYRPVNNSPLGSSVLRAAFDPWNQKQQLKREFLKYLTQFASPSLIGITPPNALPYQKMNADGTPMVDTAGNPVMATPEEDLMAALQGFHNGTAIALPNGAAVQPIQMSSQAANPFLQAFEHCDRQITKAVLQQTLATEEGEHQARAATQTHKDVLDTLTRQGKRPLERMLRHDVLRTWLLLNKGESYLKLLPLVSLGETQQEDKPSMWAAAAQLQAAGYIHASQYAAFDAMLGLPPRDVQATTPEVRIDERVQIPGAPVAVPALPNSAAVPEPLSPRQLSA